jgi:hypothetical protein
VRRVHPSYRNGLLPDAKGVQSLPMPTLRDAELIAQACGGPTYTTPVLRPWEDKQ